MSSEHSPIDSNPFFRYLHLHVFMHIYRVMNRSKPSEYISGPRFELFKRIQRFYHSREEHSLFRNLIFTFLKDVVFGIVIALISASLNLLVPELIRQFMQFMKEKHLKESQYSNFIYYFVLVHVLKTFFSEHSKRLFHELAIKVESTLARKLISKSLRISKECRDRIPESQIIQLENVDLKLIFNLFKNMNMIFEAPFTITVAIILLFNQSSHYGFIGIYWFLIMFLLQRELDGRMTRCNTTKLKLIEQRSNLNYHLLDTFMQAKLIGWEDVIIQKNNDLFIEENHDHDIFYSYMTYYDITLLMLPIFVVATITIFDANQDEPITVEQVYVMLSLLGICYNPMKSMRIISINLHDGLHSLNRLRKYFDFPESNKSGLIEKKGKKGEIIIFEGTKATYPHSSSKFEIHITEEVVIEPGERLILLGKKHSGRRSFLQMLVGNLKRVEGKISIGGRISFMSQKPFFLKDTVKENIRFFNKTLTNLQIEDIYNELGINLQLRYQNDLNTMIDDTSKFSKPVLKKIAIARCLCAEADIYILSNPFLDLNDQYVTVVEKKLRELQERKKTVVMSLTRLAYSDDEDQVIILEDGLVSEYDYFNVMVNSVQSQIFNYFKMNDDELGGFNNPLSARNVLKKFQERVQTAKNYDLKSATTKDPIKRQHSKKSPGLPMNTLTLQPKRQVETVSSSQRFQSFVMKFITSISFKESIYIFIVILAAEVLHIFIHFFIGHEYEQCAKDDFANYKNLMITEVVLTFCLAGLLYLQGEFSTLIAIIIGNNIYKDSFKQLTNKSVTWYVNQYSVKLADRYNHDYEEIYIACHSIFGIYKNLVILIATIEFISTNRSKLIAIFIVLAAMYYSIFILFRKVTRKIVKHYYDYKYNFVRCLQESIQGSELFNICQIKNDAISRAESKYRELAAYKLSASYTNYGLSLICDIFSISLLAVAIQYGIQMKIHHRNQSISVVATSIFLLMNISEVLKTIICEILNFQSFFSINLIPFMELKDISAHQSHQQQAADNAPISNYISGHRIQFKHVILEFPGENTQRSLLSFAIEEGEIVHIYEKNQRCRELLLLGLTKNLPMFSDPAHFKTKMSTIQLGGVSIKDASRAQWLRCFGLIMEENFFFAGTIKDNIKWRLPDFNQEQAQKYAQRLKIYKDYNMPDHDILSAKLEPEQSAASSLIRKVAILRIMLRKPPVVIIKDCDEFVDGIYITELLREEIPSVTIIKLSRQIEHSFDADRIIAMEDLKIIEKGVPDDLKQDPDSKVGKEILNINLKSYTFMKKVGKISKSHTPSR